MVWFTHLLNVKVDFTPINKVGQIADSQGKYTMNQARMHQIGLCVFMQFGKLTSHIA